MGGGVAAGRPENQERDRSDRHARFHKPSSASAMRVTSEAEIALPNLNPPSRIPRLTW